MDRETIYLFIALAGAFGTWQAFLVRMLNNLRKEMYKELDKMKKLSDERDNDIKDLIREMKQDLKEDMKEIKNDIRRAESFKCAGQSKG